MQLPRWIRTVPEGDAEQLAGLGRAYVHDPFTEQLAMDHDYHPVLAQLEGPVVLVEWDVAVSWEDRQAFTRAVTRDPDRVQVAPYRLYPASTGLLAPVWAHRTVQADRQYRWIDTGEIWCDYFSFGLVYLPDGLGPGYAAEVPGIASDTSFSQWHYRRIQRRVPVHWNIRPVHLHY